MIESQLAQTGTAAAMQQPRTIAKRAIASWVLYDLANTIFSMGVISLIFPLYVQSEVGRERADPIYALITAFSMAIIFVASPLLGAMTDRAPRRIPFLVVSTVICVSFTVLLARSGLVLSAVFFIVANIAYQAGLQFYDALLPEVSDESNRGKIGGIGVGVGYLGSYIAVGITIIFANQTNANLFLMIAGAFLLFAIPCFLFVKERGNPKPQPINVTALRESLRETIRTLRSSQEYPGLLRFLIGRVFYTDSINTVISIMALYTVNVAVGTGLTQEQGNDQASLILLSAITFAVAGGFFWGWLADKLGPKRTLNMVLQAWIAIFIGAALVGILSLPLWTLYVIAACAGFSLGGVWAADRPYMLRLTPPSRIGEFYGLYGMVGRFSAITGPIIWAIVTFITIQALDLEPHVGQGIGVLVLLALTMASYIILQPVSDQPRTWSADDAQHADA